MSPDEIMLEIDMYLADCDEDKIEEFLDSLKNCISAWRIVKPKPQDNTCLIYSREECIFNYCPLTELETCKIANRCQQPRL